MLRGFCFKSFQIRIAQKNSLKIWEQFCTSRSNFIKNKIQLFSFTSTAPLLRTSLSSVISNIYVTHSFIHTIFAYLRENFQICIDNTLRIRTSSTLGVNVMTLRLLIIVVEVWKVNRCIRKKRRTCELEKIDARKNCDDFSYLIFVLVWMKGNLWRIKSEIIRQLGVILSVTTRQFKRGW
jgi:hypothetical protein